MSAKAEPTPIDMRRISGFFTLDVRKGNFPHAKLTHEECMERMCRFVRTQTGPRGTFEEISVAECGHLQLFVHFVFMLGEGEDGQELMFAYRQYLEGMFSEHRFELFYGHASKLKITQLVPLAAE